MANSPSGDSMTSRIVRIISAFDGTHPAMSVAALSRRAGLPLSTTHRLATDLVAHGLLQREPGGGIRPGIRLWELASRSASALDLRAVAMPFMEDIQAVVRQHTQLSVLQDDEVLFIERLSSRGSVLNRARVANRLPLHISSSGMVMMAHSPRHVQEAYLGRSAAGAGQDAAPSGDGLRQQWAAMRQYGYASLPGIVVPETTGIAVPVFDAAGNAVAAIGVVVPTGAENPAATVPALMTAARGITRGLGVGSAHAGPHHNATFPIQ
ncbi:IclR family transcriptional regulator [Arthrobacter sp. zg-Y820]|uniref:IclR family transcriptional regulator n=1 Tax=unclassified Arthrobacter TaxID=235627 RepID=UPI001E43607C|nr:MULTISPECIES: IclR family transcriptional regulator [unclassified Arthrobacter]MCC9195778.1 IclR family transcriptional regulator [Arthrobacter sp. zg-Y820]MDK1278637.1 IclR family transcriptional regulator [Arthrobacter sp. zg.Y820]MDK1359765.1 IclR family transcriptional regulator [Arthrobacter sp. zg-Y1219]WIB08932.1 IclR family transcriptional regulator [Arthrobacter sp. zg-Y820]